MVSNNEIKKDSDSRKIFSMIVMIATLMVCTTSATYAYFALSPVSNNAITGTAATASLTLSVTKTNPASNTGPLVPQLTSALGTAMNSTNKCVDGNSNVICQVYTVTVKNTSTAKVVVSGTITFSGSTNMPNLKWYKASSATSLGATLTDATAYAANTTSVQTIESNVSLATNASKTYYIVVWIHETGSAQTDTGTYRATIEFTSSNGTGVTSTIVS